jgi:hypothetical protein
MEAWRQSQRIKRETVALLEMPIASLAALTANINRNSEKRSEPFTLNDFLIFKDHDANDKGKLTAATSAAVQDLRRRRLLPEFMLAAWPEVLKSAKPGVGPPECIALRSACESVWLINPIRESGGIRCGLVGVHGVVRGPIKVQDPDRLLIWHTVVLPARDAAGWIAHDLFLPMV